MPCTGLFLTSLVATSIVKFMMLMLDSLSIWYLKVKTSINIWNKTILVATDDVKIALYLKTFKYGAAKGLKDWVY